MVMLGVMENENVTEGLFLKNYLGTVSAVPKTRTAAHMDINSFVNQGRGEYHKNKEYSLENGMPNHAKIIYELKANNEIEINANRKPKQSETISHKNGIFENGVQVENDDDKEKKKEKKWTLGGLFRRKSKKDADDSSEGSDDENKKGFLSRRKSKRERRKVKGRSTANGFDVVIPQQKEKIPNGVGLTAEQLWSGDGKVENPADANNGPVRFIHRRQPNEPPKGKDTLQLPKHSRRDSNLSKSSGGSENLEGRKGRKEVMARAEAKRDMMRDDSSSDESYHSNSSLGRPNPDPFQKERRSRRSDRHAKRLLRDDDVHDLRVIKSDFEGGRRIPATRWGTRIGFPDASDYEAARVNLMNHSGASSPSRSPRARQKQLLQYMSMMQNGYPTSTFPPGVHYQQSRGVVPNQFCPPRGYAHAKENYLQESQSFGNVSYRNQRNRSSEYFHNLPRSLSSIENAPNRKTVDYDQLYSCNGSKEKSMSFDHDIHRASYFQNDPPQLPISKPIMYNGVQSSRSRGEMFPTDEKKSDVYIVNATHRGLKAYENENGVAENRTESTPSLSIQSGIFPLQPTQINVQRSASGNAFCGSYDGSMNVNPSRSISYQHIPNHHWYRSQNDATPMRAYRTVQPDPNLPKDNFYSNLPAPKSNETPIVNGTSSILRYYADQNPRSRNPIHITCNPMTGSNPNTITEQPYLSDSQVVVKPVQPRNVTNASDFWKLKDQEIMLRNGQKKADVFGPRLPISKSDRSGSNSPRFKDSTGNQKDTGSSGVCSETKPADNRKVFKEEYNVTKVNRTPPDPPVRRLSKQEVLARLHKCEELQNKENELNKNLKNDIKTQNSNLDDALNELEIIYNSLRLKDDDLVDRAERRDLPIFRPGQHVKEYNSLSVRDKIQNFYAETDYPPKSPDARAGHQRAVPLRRSGVPDKTTDDMAFRRMNSRDRPDFKKLPSQSYLRSSPALSPVPPEIPKECPGEPDVTYDDVVFRNIRHANSTLKIQDPQPPFGIPIGVITPAPNSDYLHATPKDRFRPTFTSSKTPDVVKDDLAFRNLRKDNKTNKPVVDFNKNDQLKKRAVRSLSANLYNIMQKSNSGSATIETNNNLITEKNSEKTQSLTDLSNEKWAEKRLKELKEEKNAKRAEFFELSQELRKKKEGENLSWTDLANLNGDFKNLETTAKTYWNSTTKTPPTPEKKSFRSPIVKLSKYPAAVPSSSLQGNPFKEPTPGSPVDEKQIEDLLTALADEAKNASKDLERQLDELDTKLPKPMENPAKDKTKTAVEEFNAKFKSDKTKRRRNLSLSNASETKEETHKTGSLERRKVKKLRNEDAFPFDEWTKKIKASRKNSGVTKREVESPFEDGRLTPPSKSESISSLTSRDRKSSQTFQEVTDLSQILEAEQHSPCKVKNQEKEDIFQEVYEYNCRLESSDRSRSEVVSDDGTITSEGGLINGVTEAKEETDVEMEFEKLHEEVDGGSKLSGVDDLLADIASVNPSGNDSYSTFPFPREVPGERGFKAGRDGSYPGSGKGEGIKAQKRSPAIFRKKATNFV